MVKSFQIDEDKVLELYQKLSLEFQQMLEDALGKEFFNRKITDRVKTYEDACAILEIDPLESLPDTSDRPREDRKAYLAFHKLVTITRALNEGWRPDWNNPYQPKWFNWWWTNGNAGLAYASSHAAHSGTAANVGSRLCFKSEALADYAAETFKELYEDYLMFK